MTSTKVQRKVRTLTVDRTLKKRPERLPWPRTAPDNPSIQLGVNVKEKEQDIKKLVHKFFRIRDYDMNDILQEVYTTILNKNFTNSAHDPRKSSFGHYVYLISRNVIINLVNKKKRYDRESESIDLPIAGSDDSRSIIETYMLEDDNPFIDKHDPIKDYEIRLRREKRWELARFICAVDSGASNEVVKEALSYGKRQVTNKVMRSFRHQISSWASEQRSA